MQYGQKHSTRGLLFMNCTMFRKENENGIWGSDKFLLVVVW